MPFLEMAYIFNALSNYLMEVKSPLYPETHSEPRQTSNMDVFAERVNNKKIDSKSKQIHFH